MDLTVDQCVEELRRAIERELLARLYRAFEGDDQTNGAAERPAAPREKRYKFSAARRAAMAAGQRRRHARERAAKAKAVSL
jgi:hypothetical protein